MFDSFLLQQGATSMLDARDAMLAADRMRFAGDDQQGHVATPSPSAAWARAPRRRTPTRATPTPSFASPRERNGTRALRRPGPRQGLRRALRGPRHAGRRHRPEPRRWARRQASRPGRYELLYVSTVARLQRFTVTVRAGDHRTVTVPAAAEPGGQRERRVRDRPPATARSTTDALIDGTEATNWGGVTDGQRRRLAARSWRSTSPAACRPSAGSRSARCCARPTPTRTPCRP